MLLAMEFGFDFSHAKAAKCPGDIYSHRLSCLCKGVAWFLLGEGCNCMNLQGNSLREGVVVGDIRHSGKGPQVKAE